jgi:ACS family tartrate transporter-like MFS transporter
MILVSAYDEQGREASVGFAALQMNADLHFTASVFGFGAGVMCVTYMLGEAPSNLVLVHRSREWSRPMPALGSMTLAIEAAARPVRAAASPVR